MKLLVNLVFAVALAAILARPVGVLASDLIVPATTSTNSFFTSSNSPGGNFAVLRRDPVALPTNAPEFIISEGEKYASVSFARLASFSYSTQAIADATSEGTDTAVQEAQIPTSIKSLNEKSVAVTGFMLPLHSSGDFATDFLLLRNQSACCYGVMPKINEWVVVRTTGKGVKVTMDIPITVLGTLHVGEIRENGELSGIYKLDCDRMLNPKS